MTSRILTRRWPRALLLGSAGMTLGAGAAHAEGDWTRRFRVGLVTAVNVEAEFTFGGAFNLSGNNPGAPGVSGVDHFYDNGQVRVDDTGNAGGYTTFWSYQDAGQYDALNETLTFNGTTSFALQGSDVTNTEEPYFGLDLAYGGRLTDVGTGVLGWEFGFSVMPMNFEDTDPHPVLAERVTHRFSTAGIVVPQAPYSGSSSGIGPAISDVATEIGTSISPGLLTGSRELEALYFDFRLGPNLQWHLGGRWAASLGGGVAMGLVSGEYTFNEQIEFNNGTTLNRGGESSTKLTFGGWGEGMIYWRSDQKAELYLGVQYSALGDATFGSGGREVRLKLGNGIRFLAGIHWIF